MKVVLLVTNRGSPYVHFIFIFRMFALVSRVEMYKLWYS